MSDTLTRGVRILVKPQYVADQSDPANDHYLFAYHITIRNEGSEAVQLISRHWVITNGEGQVEEVRGPGVVGSQPELEPGQEFQYTRGCPRRTPVGSMHGEFTMGTRSGERFDARIAPFTLAVPRAVN